MSKKDDLGFCVFDDDQPEQLGAFFDEKEDAIVHAARLNRRLAAEPKFGIASVSVVISAEDMAGQKVPDRPESDNDAEVRRMAQGGVPASELD